MPHALQTICIRKALSLLLTVTRGNGVLILVVLCYRGFGQSSVPTLSDSAPQGRHAAYLQLNRKIYARHENPGSGDLDISKGEGHSANQQLNEMIAKEIGLALSAPKPSAKSVSSAIAALQGDITLSGWGPEETNTPFAKFFSFSGIQTAAITYVILQGGDATPDTQPYLVFYDNASGVWMKKASAPTLVDFEECTFSVAQLNSGVPGEVWFLAWGGGFGSSSASIKLRLYAFDGAAVRTVWKRNSVNAGKVSSTSDTVTLDYLDSEDMSIEKHEVFHVTPNGLLPQ